MHQKLLQIPKVTIQEQAFYWWYIHIPDLLQNAEESDDYEDVSYNVESLFPSIPVKKTID